MISASIRARHIAACVSLLVLSSSARAQTTPDSAATGNARSAARTIVELSPSRPRQGSVVRITLRGVFDTAPKPTAAAPAAKPMASAPRDTVRMALDTARVDSLTTAAATVRPRLDSLRAILDTLAPRRATLDPTGASPAGRGDSVILGAAPRDTLEIHATLFGEPLHFRREESGEYVAIAGIPVDAPATVRLGIVLARTTGSMDTTVVSLTIGRTAYKMEKLTVAPKFGQKPDSALAVRIAREQALASSVSRRSHGTPRLWEGAFQRPREARVTSAFGDGRQFNGAIQSRHMGLDLAGAVGAPVLATNRGVVALVGDFYYAGNAVYIDHGAGLVTAYFHLSATDVAQGDTVSPGARLGRVGATGRVTGPHLHWVARYGAVTVDPSTLLELQASVDSAASPAQKATDPAPVRRTPPPDRETAPPAIRRVPPHELQLAPADREDQLSDA